MKKTVKADVVIIGSGAIGNSTAFYLSKEGLKVVVLDREQIANSASVRNGAMNKLTRRGVGELPVGVYGAHEVWPKVSEITGIDMEYKQTGGYRIIMEDDDWDTTMRFEEEGRKAGLHFENMTGEELRKRTPQFSEKIKAAVRCEEESRANPLKIH